MCGFQYLRTERGGGGERRERRERSETWFPRGKRWKQLCVCGMCVSLKQDISIVHNKIKKIKKINKRQRKIVEKRKWKQKGRARKTVTTTAIQRTRASILADGSTDIHVARWLFVWPAASVAGRPHIDQGFWSIATPRRGFAVKSLLSPCIARIGTTINLQVWKVWNTHTQRERERGGERESVCVKEIERI